MGIKLKPAYGSHIPVLLKLLSMTNGDVLELGTGMFSTPFLHWACYQRHLVSYESDFEYYYQFSRFFRAPHHEVHLVNDWDTIEIERPWDIALIDHSPPERRVVDALRLANWAKFIVVHDTQVQAEKTYGYNAIYGNFKYRFDHVVDRVGTTVLSNSFDLRDFTL